PTANTITVNVTSVNDAPSGADKTVTTLEDAPYTFTAADFGFTDPIDAASAAGTNSLLAVKITALPGAGSLTDNGVQLTAGQLIVVADINAGLLTFAPSANGNGNGYSSFTFELQDHHCFPTRRSSDLPTANTITVNVTSVNDAPSGADKTVTTLEDA